MSALSISGWKVWKQDLPELFAEYIATSALRSSVSVSTFAVADAGRSGDQLVGHAHRLGEHRPNAFGYNPCGGVAVDEHGELVPAQPRNEVSRSRALAKSTSDFHEQLVAGRMAE
jgi:hypothetical protein